VISVESSKISAARIFCVPAEWVSFELGVGAWNKKTRMKGLPGREEV